MTVVYIILTVMVGFNIYVYFALSRIKQRERVLQNFVAGIIRAISDYKSPYDKYSDDIPEVNKSLPIPFDKLLDTIWWEVGSDMEMEHFDAWLKLGRNLFQDSRPLQNEGFNLIYQALHEKRSAIWFSDSPKIMSASKKAYLRDDIEVTEENVGELDGEIGMFKDVVNGKLDNSVFTPENIDLKLMMMFNHIDEGKRMEAKSIILERLRTEA
ncbi:MAG: hypothetical protein OEL57_14745 [Trichlorobacter sp.]|uniref:hypothetical protein n=1 Tax=Trichlorobacter sp. TaxID=2911007 RepID=UPI00255D61B2|nr:hypothetical protein [Trichlorobacter sp.]MDK9719141.1 hypothetical protein [Trichlorobacter sp.]